MTEKKSTQTQSAATLFGLPNSSSKANQVFYGLMLSGVFSIPIIFLAYPRYLEPGLGLTIREFFIVFTATYLVIFSYCSACAVKATARLRKSLDQRTPNDVAILAPLAANNGSPEIFELGHKFWFWQLVVGYLSGTFFSWFVCLFLLFIA
jgi:hypothetical protein